MKSTQPCLCDVPIFGGVSHKKQVKAEEMSQNLGTKKTQLKAMCDYKMNYLL